VGINLLATSPKGGRSADIFSRQSQASESAWAASHLTGFLDGPKVMKCASDIMVAVFGDKAGHARTMSASPLLPEDAAVAESGRKAFFGGSPG